MKQLTVLFIILFFFCPMSSVAQLIVFDNSHGPGHSMYDALIDSLVAWGFDVEKRTTALTDNDDADVLVILPEDAYRQTTPAYSAGEAAWIKSFVDSGKGLFASVCPADSYWANIQEIMTIFGIVEANTNTNPTYYNVLADHPLFTGVIELGNDIGNATSITVSTPSVPIAGNGNDDFIAAYENGIGGGGASVWTSHYYMLDADGLVDYDNLQYLRNLFEWLAQGGGQFFPECQISENSFNFGTIPIGETASAEFHIYNTGSGPLLGDVSVACDDFSIVSGGGMFSIYPNASLLVEVQFTPSQAGPQSCIIETGESFCADIECAGNGAVSEVPSPSFNGTSLFQNSPNPFNPSTKLSFEISVSGHALLKVYDTMGHLVRTLVDEPFAEGRYEVTWNGRDNRGRMSATGVYLYRLEVGNFHETRRMVLLK